MLATAYNPTLGPHGALIPSSYVIVINGDAAGSIAVEMQRDVYSRSAELGYWLGEAYWGQGVMGKVVPAFVAWVWTRVPGLERINAETRADNEASMRVLGKAGFVREGRRERAVWKLGRFWDVVFWGLVRSRGDGGEDGVDGEGDGKEVR